MATLKPAEWIDLIIDSAPRLRDAGVTTLALGSVRIELAPAASRDAAPMFEQEAEHEEHPDPLMDPATFGRRNSLPGYERPREPEEDEEIDDEIEAS